MGIKTFTGSDLLGILDLMENVRGKETRPNQTFLQRYNVEVTESNVSMENVVRFSKQFERWK